MNHRISVYFCLIAFTFVVIGFLPGKTTVHAGTWNISIGEKNDWDVPLAIAETSDGGFEMIARSKIETASGPIRRYEYMETDDNGNVISKQKIYDSKSRIDKVIKKTSDQGFIIGEVAIIDENQEGCEREMFDDPCTDVMLIKTDAGGNEIWRTYFGRSNRDDSFGNVIQTQDGGYIVISDELMGLIIDPDVEFSPPLMVVTRLDANGKIGFQKRFSYQGSLDGLFVSETEENNIIIAGKIHTVQSDIFLLMLDGKGNEIWWKTYGGESYQDELDSFAVLSDGGFITASRRYDLNGYSGVNIFRFDRDGNVVWNKIFFDTGPRSVISFIASIEETSDQGFIATGLSPFDGDDRDLLLAKLSPEGDELWRRLYGGIKIEEGFAAHETSDGGFIVAGGTTSYLPGRANLNPEAENPGNIWLLKTDETGSVPHYPQNLPARFIGYRNWLKNR